MAWFSFCLLSSVYFLSVFSMAWCLTDVIMPCRSARPSLCRVRHQVAIGWGWQLLYRLRVILDLDSFNQSSQLVHHNNNGKTDCVKLNFETAQCSSLLCSLLNLHKNFSHSMGAQLYEADAISSLAFLRITSANRIIVG